MIELSKAVLHYGKKQIIAGFLEEYDIQSVEDIQKALADLPGPVIQSMLEGEMSEHPGYWPYERSEGLNSHNGKKDKRLRSKCVEIPISVPQNRESTFEPKVVKKRQISKQIYDIYGFEVSEELVLDITDKLLPQIDVICPIFKFSADVRKVTYTTNVDREPE